MSLRKLSLRIRLAAWAFRNPDRLTMLHFSLLRDESNCDPYEDYRLGWAHACGRYAYDLRDMPGAAENRAAL